jgi:hypothetical protein
MSGDGGDGTPAAPSYSTSKGGEKGPQGLWRAPACLPVSVTHLLGRTTYDLDAASDWGPDISVRALRRLVPADDALNNPWFREPLDPLAPVTRLPLVWLNPPFGRGWGGKKAWVEVAQRHAVAGALVAFYCPAYGDTWADPLEAEALTTIRMGGGRVRHIPPPGVSPSSPGPVAHRIWLLGPQQLRARWPYQSRLVWNHRTETWIRPPLAPPWFPALDPDLPDG